MRCLLLYLALSLTSVWRGCYSRSLLLVKELPESLEYLRSNGSHIQPKDGARQSALSCGDHTISPGEVQTVRSENYPEDYPNNLDCYWTFQTNEASTLSFFCEDFDVRYSRQCRRDFLEIKDFAAVNYRICGTDEFEPLESMDSFVVMRFKTNRRGSARGFSCTISASSADGITASSPESSTQSVSTPSKETTDGSTNTDCTCGVRNTAARIVGGEETEVHEYPWQVGLVPFFGSTPYCGGSVISSEWILTAAHCVNRNTVSSTAVVIGEHDWSTSGESTVTQRLSLARVVRHPRYRSRTSDNDIALLKLAEPITFPSDNKIAPVCLPTPGNLYANVNATITGWGTLSSGGSQPAQLNEVTVPTMTNAACRATGYDDDEITENMICAGVPEGGKDSCQGDSGGPMVTGSGSMQQIGVVSWGHGCADSRYPGVYTRVTNYVSWIQSEIAGSETCPPAA